jgi:hypothetical protein
MGKVKKVTEEYETPTDQDIFNHVMEMLGYAASTGKEQTMTLFGEGFDLNLLVTCTKKKKGLVKKK